ncbi:MAG: type II toxin-antitoxin system RelE/ParE family toxin, partial [Rhodospirillales bacterium]
YRALLAAAMRRVAAEPAGASTLCRDELAPGLRSFHLRHSRDAGPGDRVANPVYIIYYRAAAPGLVEIVRVLHERSDPVRHLDAGKER